MERALESRTGTWDMRHAQLCRPLAEPPPPTPGFLACNKSDQKQSTPPCGSTRIKEELRAECALCVSSYATGAKPLRRARAGHARCSPTAAAGLSAASRGGGPPSGLRGGLGLNLNPQKI
jgi:hypothetical protein